MTSAPSGSTRPVLAVPRHGVGVAGDDHAGRLARAERREQVRLPALVVEGQPARDAVAGQLVADELDEREVRLPADGVDADERARHLERARGGSGGHVHRCNIATAPLPPSRWTSTSAATTSTPRARRIASDIRHTPLLRIDGGQLGIDGVELWLKLEHLQVGGSFKARGMFNRMRSNAIPAAGVVIASGGNAGIAVACAAKALGVPLRGLRSRVVEPRQARQARGARRDRQRRRRRATAMPSPPASRARPRAARC